LFNRTIFSIDHSTLGHIPLRYVHEEPSGIVVVQAGCPSSHTTDTVEAWNE